jgi:hypothetical protein
MTREVFLTDAYTVSWSHGDSERRSITSTLIPLSSAIWLAAASARCTVAPYVTSVTSVPRGRCAPCRTGS